jgi:MoxR-like ATPase
VSNGAVGQRSVADVARIAGTVLDAVGTVMVGKRDALRMVLAGILAGGHVLLEDLPGLGKTMTARSFAQALGLGFRRLQFTPDLMPADVTGSFLYDQRSHDFSFRAGPLFTTSCWPTRSTARRRRPGRPAGGDAGEQVTVEGTTYVLEPPFHVLATANPIEHEGTYPLPEAQLDRFLVRVSFGYPDADEEWDVLRRRMARRREESVLAPVIDATNCSACRRRSRTSPWRTRSGGTWSS